MTGSDVEQQPKAAGEVLTAKQAPGLAPARHRPGARSARRERCLLILSQTTLAREILMWIQNYFKSLTSTPTRRRPIRRRPPSSRLSLEALEDRCLLSAVHPLFDLGSPAGGPFASDRFTVADPTQETGLHIKLPLPDAPQDPSGHQ